MYIFMYIFVYIYTYIYIYTYVYIHTHMDTAPPTSQKEATDTQNKFKQRGAAAMHACSRGVGEGQ